METQGLCGDLGDACKLLIREFQVILRGAAHLFHAEEIQKVGDGLERVVDLVRDGGGKPAHRGELFALDQRGLGTRLT